MSLPEHSYYNGASSYNSTQSSFLTKSHTMFKDLGKIGSHVNKNETSKKTKDLLEVLPEVGNLLFKNDKILHKIKYS